MLFLVTVETFLKLRDLFLLLLFHGFDLLLAEAQQDLVITVRVEVRIALLALLELLILYLLALVLLIAT